MAKFCCALCGSKQDEDQGSWNRDPYLFFCCDDCHEKWENEQKHKQDKKK